MATKSKNVDLPESESQEDSHLVEEAADSYEETIQIKEQQE
jgi:hypothetical protein